MNLALKLAIGQNFLSIVAIANTVSYIAVSASQELAILDLYK